MFLQRLNLFVESVDLEYIQIEIYLYIFCNTDSGNW